jgi:hypothetical protein
VAGEEEEEGEDKGHCAECPRDEDGESAEHRCGGFPAREVCVMLV